MSSVLATYTDLYGSYMGELLLVHPISLHLNLVKTTFIVSTVYYKIDWSKDSDRSTKNEETDQSLSNFCLLVIRAFSLRTNRDAPIR